MKSIYIAPIQKGAGGMLFSLYFMEMLKSKYNKVAFFKPIIENIEEIEFIKNFFNLDIDINRSFVYTKEEAEKAVAKDENLFLENIINSYNNLLKSYDFVLIEGISKDEFSIISDDINLHISKNLSSSIVSIMNDSELLEDELDIEYHNIINSNNRHLATIVNKTTKNIKKDYPVFFVENIETLQTLSINQLQEELNAKIIENGNIIKNIKEIKIASMGVDNFISHIKDNDLVIVGGDRSDIIISSFAFLASKKAPNISCLLLTGGITPINLNFIIEGFDEIVPILSTNFDTYTTAKTVEKIIPKISKMDKNLLLTVLGKLEKDINKNFFLEKLNFEENIVTTLMFKYSIFEKAKKTKRKIVLPELDDRILKASEILLNRDIVDIIFIGDEVEYEYRAKFIGVDISKATIINPKKEEKLIEEFANRFYNLRKHKGIKLEDSYDLMISDETYFATMMVECGYANGMVSGATHTTADTVRPALQIIKTVENTPLVSSLFFMALDTKVLVFADCAINQNPSSLDLATIAISSHDTAKKFGIEPKVAMLSYSTGSSGSGEDVERVREATNFVKKIRKDILIEGPIQYDSAVDKDVAKLKLPNSEVAGEANILIFPDLNTGNNTYKAVQRSANAVAIGPVLQGLNRPVNDLSRGCTVDDIVNTVAITAIQAGE